MGRYFIYGYIGRDMRLPSGHYLVSREFRSGTTLWVSSPAAHYYFTRCLAYWTEHYAASQIVK
uniref:Uncharacterized protein n=1 Tax=Picea glauca TaxID=3330 RepID=A0A117NHP1_PICGL|nr:hypothetical protein ABT39_MTgene4708 [Picea glauca]QHR90941.1 hypothetical protein Q903MT_gene4970 [Picea sitchensis]